MSDVAVRVEGLGKAYTISHQQAHGRYKTLQEDLIALVKRPFGSTSFHPRRGQFWALKDVSFDVKQGEVLGIIGRNGAGKSTLLKILSRITRPTTGLAEVTGRVGSLLEVGTGFHPELTGRENIFLNGAILGMSRNDIRRQFDAIVDFAEIGQFLDTPVKRYSSGMYMRLAFAVAAHLEPEILVVDEVLAVGDAEFQKKSLGKMGEVARSGRTVLFVSHNMAAVETLCTNCLWLSHGEVSERGAPRVIISHYMKTDSSETEWCSPAGGSVVANAYFDPSRIAIVDTNLQVLHREIAADEVFGILIEGHAEKLNSALTVGYAFYSGNGELLFWTLHTDVEETSWPPVRIGRNRLLVWLPSHLFNEGDYRVELILSLHYQEWLSEPGNNAPSLAFTIRGGLSKSPYWMVARPGLLGPVLPFVALEVE